MQWNSYVYTDGYSYVRGRFSGSAENPTRSQYTYKDGTKPEINSIRWFKVESIIWLVINYENILSGADNTINVLSYVSFSDESRYASTSTWSESMYKNYLNTKFLNLAFNESEQSRINMTTVYTPIGSTSIDECTQKIYLLSIDEIELIMPTATSRLCSPTDYMLSLFTYNSSYDNDTSYRSGLTVAWATRTHTEDGVQTYISANGLISITSVYDMGYVLRPAMQLML